jgi:hypothetical protein
VCRDVYVVGDAKVVHVWVRAHGLLSSRAQRDAQMNQVMFKKKNKDDYHREIFLRTKLAGVLYI